MRELAGDVHVVRARLIELDCRVPGAAGQIPTPAGIRNRLPGDVVVERSRPRADQKLRVRGVPVYRRVDHQRERVHLLCRFGDSGWLVARVAVVGFTRPAGTLLGRGRAGIRRHGTSRRNGDCQRYQHQQHRKCDTHPDAGTLAARVSRSVHVLPVRCSHTRHLSLGGAARPLRTTPRPSISADDPAPGPSTPICTGARYLPVCPQLTMRLSCVQVT